MTEPVNFERVSAVIRLGDNNNMQIPLHRGAPFVTPGEYMLLESIHGKGTVKITGTGEQTDGPVKSPQIATDHRMERERLSMLYDKVSNVDKSGRMPVDRLFPGTGQMPMTFADIGVDVSKAQATLSEVEAANARIAELEAQLKAKETAETEADDLLGDEASGD